MQKIPEDVLSLIIKSHSMNRLGSLKRHKAYKSLCDITNFLPLNCHVKQRLWHVINNQWHVPTCPICNNYTTWRKEHGKYNKYCSSKCAHQDQDVLNRAKQTLIDNHGEQKVFGTNAFKSANKEHMLNKYGVENISQLDHIKETKKQTSLKNYGVSHPMKSDEIRFKVSSTNKKKYGHSNFLASDIGKEKLYEYYKNNNSTMLQSRGETEIFNFVQTLSPNVIQNDRTLIFPLELDIVDKQKKIAIEYCGVFWHSEQQGKDKWYHHTKWKKCKDRGYQLLTIFSDEWEYKKDIIKSKLTYLFQQSDDVCYARNCDILPISMEARQAFFEKYHIQGDGTGKLAYGLIYQQELVAGIILKSNGPDFLIDRYATSKRIPGGFSKLIKFIENTLTYDTLFTFADLRWSTGHLYELNKFMLDKILPPDYSYSKDGICRVHKFNYRRKYLPKLLDNFDPLLSEKQNCNNNKILRIWDCGKQKWVKPNPK